MKAKSPEDYKKELAFIHPTIELLGEYKTNKTNARFRCLRCKYEWETQPKSLLQGHGCKVCAGKLVGPAPEYRNSIWSNDKFHGIAVKYGMTEEQMQTMPPSSPNKIKLACPDCGVPKSICPSQLFYVGFACKLCSPYASIPEKFIYAFFHIIGIDVECEYSRKWTNGKKYDFVNEELSLIVETNGSQHFYDKFPTAKRRTLDEEKENDEYKKALAIENGMVNYFPIDCRETNLNYLKTNIINSGLLTFLNIEKEAIDWERCYAMCMSEDVKLAAEYWNSGEKIVDIARKLNKNRTTINRYLNKAKAAGLCEYNTKQEGGLE